MKKIVFWIIASLLLFLYLFFSFSNPEAKIGESFQQACQEVIAAQEMEGSSYASAFKLYNNAVAKINNIVDKHSSSEIALNLFKNKQKIGPYAFHEFKEEFIPQAKLRAEAENNPLDCSFYAVNLLDTVQFDDKLKLMKAAKLTEISIRYSKLWRYKKAATILSKGKEIVQTIYSNFFKVSAYAELAQILDSAGKKKEALQLLSQAKTTLENMSPYEQSEALGKIIAGYCSIGQVELALETVPQYDSANHDNSWSIISKHYAVNEKFDSALEIAKNIKDDNLLAETFQVIIRQYAANGRYEKAKELIAKINPMNIACKIKALADIGFYAGKEGQRNLGISYFEQAIKTANQFESYQLSQKLSALNYIAARFIELNDYQNAVKLLESNSAAAKKLSEFNRAEVFAEIAVSYGQMGELEKAIQLVNSYIPVYLIIEIQGDTLAQLALEYANNGQYQKALELAYKIPDETTLLGVNKASALSQIAIIAATTKDYQTALKIAKEINSPFYKPWTFGEIALQIANKRVPLRKKTMVKQYLHQIISALEPNKNPDEGF